MLETLLREIREEGYREGYEKSYKEGYKKGIEEAVETVALNAYKEGKSIEFISEISSNG